MIVVLGVVGALVLIGAVVGIVYFAGNRGRTQDIADTQAAARGHRQGNPQEPERSQGRGDL